MADDADRAQVVIEAEQRALASKLARLRFPHRGTPKCLVCGEDIPEARRAAVAGCCTCFDCQDDLDRRMGR